MNRVAEPEDGALREHAGRWHEDSQERGVGDAVLCDRLLATAILAGSIA